MCVYADTRREIRVEESYKITGKSLEAELQFYRGAVSKYCYDKFLYFYKVAEDISSLICQQSNISWGSEREMLELGLQICFQNKLLDLVNQANKVGIVATQSEIIPKVASFLYQKNRCRLSHAKEGKKKKVPFKPKDEESVKKALPLMEYVAKSFLAYAEKISNPKAFHQVTPEPTPETTVFSVY